MDEDFTEEELLILGEGDAQDEERPAPEAPSEQAQEAQEAQEAQNAPPIAAEVLERERERAALIEQENQRLREHAIRLEERAKLLQPKEEPKGEPTPEDDFLGYLERLEQNYHALKSTIEQQRQEAEIIAQNNAAIEDLNHSIAAAKTTQPDILQAIDFLTTTRANQLKVLGATRPIPLSEQEITKAIGQDTLTILHACRQQRIDPAKALYDLAKASGYVPSEAPSQKLGQLEEKLNASRTLSASGGGTVSAALSLEDIANMSDQAFQGWINKDAKNQDYYDELLSRM